MGPGADYYRLLEKDQNYNSESEGENESEAYNSADEENIDDGGDATTECV